LLAAEAEARDGRLANWRGAFRVRDPDDIRNRTGTFQIVEGNIVTASVTRARLHQFSAPTTAPISR